MSNYKKDPRVDVYINALPGWQQEICRQVRDLVHSADSKVQETIKRSVQPYFVLEGNICALLAAKSHVNIFIYDPTVSDPEGIVNQGHENLTAKSIQIAQNQILNERAMKAMFREIITHNRNGGWRKIKEKI